MMPTSDYQGSLGKVNGFGRSILSFKREKIYSMDGSGDEEVELFQKHLTERFLELSSAGFDEVLSLSWIRKLLDVFLCCQEEFSVLLFNNKSQLSKSPTDRVMADFFERVVKALDVCNAIRDGVEQIKQWQKQVEIVLVAMDGRKNMGEGEFRRAKRALIDLAIGMLDGKESSMARLSRSFGRNNVDKSVGYVRSLSWSVSRSWSAAKQLQAIGSNLVPPRGGGIAASNGLVVAAYTMSSILLFVCWTLVAAIPCQDRGLQVNFSIPRHFSWAGPILSLHEQIFEESKKRERKNACSLLREILLIEKFGRHLSQLVDSVTFPLTEEKESEVRNGVAELAQVNEALKDSLVPLEQQVREVFRTLVRCRTDCHGSLGKHLS